ncbi:uncharacterized protein LOC143233662 isoform X2 [Tachypleus tridentatus]|uniref:uncharacterized protein LOC143233662 isoform X2 n=2 Tax=Tachypleus tridentatus TaxID=6853 RepID=UPI003FD1EBA9
MTSVRLTMECEDNSNSDDESSDPQKLLTAWMNELDQIKLDTDNESNYKTSDVKNDLSKPSHRMDSYRLSMANLESSQDVELDTILGELCALGSRFDREMYRGHARSVSGDGDDLRLSGASPEVQGATQQIFQLSGHDSPPSRGSKTKSDIGGAQEKDGVGRAQKLEFGLRTDSPDNDSAFSDNVSMLSSESSTSSGGGTNRSDVSSQNVCGRLINAQCTSPSYKDYQAQMKSDKIKLAMEKIQESDTKKIFIRVYTDDGCTKSLLVDERMNVAHVCRLLVEKNHTKLDLQWAVVESNFDLQLERIFEDHENIVENILMWTQDATHKLLFRRKEDKYNMFLNPQNYLLGCTLSQKSTEMDDEGKATLVEEFFSTTSVSVPEIEGNLYLKSDGKKCWKKFFFILRSSGLYYNPKGKSKLSKDLVCLATFQANHIYQGFGWRKKYKSPTDFGFAIKHPDIQVKCCKNIKFLCAEDQHTLKLWITGIRIAKFGHQLKENYENVLRDIEEEDLESLANARSFSVSSVAKTLSIASGREAVTDQQCDTVVEQRHASHFSVRSHADLRCSQRSSIIRRDSVKSSASSSSSGCSSVSTPTNDQIAFEADFHVGTIKRKPNMAPKIPLTTTTRTLAKQSVSDSHNNVVHLDTVKEANRSMTTDTSSNTLSRNSATRLTLQRSHTEDKINVNGIAKASHRKHSIDSGMLTRQMEKLQATVNSNIVETMSTDSCTVTPVNSVSDIDDLPLPPPPPELETNEDILQMDLLPPPPPEAFNSTIDLNFLPSSIQSNWPSNATLNSLPPSPNSITDSPSKESKMLQCHTYMINQSEMKAAHNAPIVPPKPKLQSREQRLLEDDNPSKILSQSQVGRKPIQSNTSPRPVQKPQQKMDSLAVKCYGTSPRLRVQPQSSGSLKTPKHGFIRKGISFSQSSTEKPDGVHFSEATSEGTSQFPTPDAVFHNQLPIIYQKPDSPKRSEAAKLAQQTHAVHRSSSTSNQSGQEHQQPSAIPPEIFLRDLQQVMEKKWKVAQQLTDLAATPHQIMGFRDPCFLPPADSSVARTAPQTSTTECVDHHSKQHHHNHSKRSTVKHTKQTPSVKKIPPPPPPKRSEHTHLSGSQ